MPLRSSGKFLTIQIRRSPIGGRGGAHMIVGTRVYPCIIGRGGITVLKREGDGCTPAGTMAVGKAWFRADRVIRPRISGKPGIIDERIGWCDDPSSGQYNRPVHLPFAASHEKLMRDDRLYDICIVLSWNGRPRMRNAGSAIFFHLTHPESRPTQGCIAVDPEIMRKLLPRLPKKVRFKVHP